jgi:hypothetical protein
MAISVRSTPCAISTRPAPALFEEPTANRLTPSGGPGGISHYHVVMGPKSADALARPTGVERADAINIRIPIEGSDESLAAGASA